MKTLLLALMLIGSTQAVHADDPYYPQYSSTPQIYGQDGRYLGNLNANPYDPNSTSNPYGRYGSQYSPDSINNPYGRYGSPYSPDSANNPYAPGAIKIGR